MNKLRLLFQYILSAVAIPSGFNHRLSLNSVIDVAVLDIYRSGLTLRFGKL